MRQDHKTNVRNWERDKQFKNKSGKTVKLNNILEDAYRHYSFHSYAICEYLDIAHPWLYYNYFIKWDELPKHFVPAQFSDGVEFGKFVIKEWQERCWKNKMFNTDDLNNYRTIDQLRANTAELFGNSITVPGVDISDCILRLWEMREEQKEAEEAEQQAERERKQRERERLEAKQEYERSRKIYEDIVRDDNYNEVQKNAEIHRNITNISETMKKNPESGVKSPVQAPVADPFSSSAASVFVDPFATASADILLCPIPSPGENQILIAPSGDKFGHAFSTVDLNHTAMLKRINGANYICFDNNSRQDFSELRRLMPFYDASRYLLLDVSTNESQNPNISAFRILQVAEMQ